MTSWENIRYKEIMKGLTRSHKVSQGLTRSHKVSQGLTKNLSPFITKEVIQFLKKNLSSDNHPNKGNYVHLDINSFIGYTFLYINGHLSAISFIGQREHFPPNTYRLLEKTYYAPEIRARFKLAWRKNNDQGSFATKYFIEHQINLAKKCLSYDALFISVQGLNRKNFCKNVLLKNLNNSTEEKWILLDGLYNTCRRVKKEEINNKKECWQNILISFRNKLDFNLPKLSEKESKWMI